MFILMFRKNLFFLFPTKSGRETKHAETLTNRLYVGDFFNQTFVTVTKGTGEIGI